MVRRIPTVSPWVPVGAGLVTLAALLGPWARSGTVDRSSVELLGSAAALDVLSGSKRILVVGAWFLVVVLVAASLVAVAWGRPRLGSLVALPLGPAMVVAWAVVASSPFSVRWGAPMGSVSGVTASLAAALVLMDPQRGGQGSSR